MFRIFKNWDGSFTIYEWSPGDDLIAGGVGIVFIILMSILVASALEYMNLPILSLMIAFLIMMYVRSDYVVLIAYPFICYTFGSICYIVWYVCETKGMGIISLMGWLILGIAAVMVMILPLLENFDSFELAFPLFLAPATMLWLGSICYWMGMSGENAAKFNRYSDNLIRYSFYFLGFALAIGVLMTIVDFVRHPVKGISACFASMGIGCGIVALMMLIGRIAVPGVIIAVIFLLAIVVVTALSAANILPVRINGYFMLPILILWILEPISFSNGIYQFVEFKGASALVDFCSSGFMLALERGFSSLTLGSFRVLLDYILNPLVSWIVSLFGATMEHFTSPIILVIGFGFLCMCITSSATLSICERNK